MVPIENIMSAVANKVRLRIVNLLLERELCVCEIQSILKMSEPRISRHLYILRQANLIECRRDAKWCYYHVKSPTHSIFAVLFPYFKKEKIYIDDLKNISANPNVCKM